MEHNWRLKRIAPFLLPVLLLAFVQGCTFYHSRPLTEAAIEDSLKTPDTHRIQVEAKQLSHPILRPVDIDFKNGLTPEGAAVVAVLANPMLRAARNKRGVVGAQLLQAGILPNPQLSYNLDFPTGTNPPGTVNAYGLGLSWDFMSLVRRGALIDAARRQSSAVDLDVAWQEWQTALEAKSHVYNLIFLTDLVETAQKQEAALEENLSTVKTAFASRDVTEVDLAAAQTALDKAHNIVLTARQQHEQERLSLNKSIGFPPEETVSLRPGMSLPEIEHIPSLETMMQGLQARRLDLVALRFGYQSQEARLRAAILAQFPSLVIGFAQARDTSDIHTTGFSIALAVPLFNRNQGQIAVERATRAQLYDEYRVRVHEARSAIASAIADARSIEQQIDAAELFIPVARRLAETYRIALLEGHGDVITYYNALNDLSNKQIDLLKLKKDLYNRMLALEIASGQFLTRFSDPEGTSQ